MMAPFGTVPIKIFVVAREAPRSTHKTPLFRGSEPAIARSLSRTSAFSRFRARLAESYAQSCRARFTELDVLAKPVLFVDPPEFRIRVESLVSPWLRERPIIVAAPGAERATVLALSAEARAAGIAPGTEVRLAQKICPDLVVLPPNPALYAKVSRAMYGIVSRFAPIVEPRGWGHLFCDVSGTQALFGPPVDVAWKMTKAVHEKIALPLAIGVAGNKLVSEVAAGVAKMVRRQDGKTASDALVPVTMGEEAKFLAPNRVDLLPDLETKLRDRLDEYQLDLIGQVAAIPVPDLCAVFGSRGRSLHATTLGIDPRPVLPPSVRAEFRVEHTLATDTNDRAELDRLLVVLSDALGRRLRRRHLAARRLRLRLTYADWMEAARTVTLSEFQLDADLRAAARLALAATLTRTVAIRSLALVVDEFVEAGLQLELWQSAPVERKVTSAQAAVDRITMRWGTTLLQRGSALVKPHPPAPSPKTGEGEPLRSTPPLPFWERGMGGEVETAAMVG
jgi:DNA polymerase-4